MKLRHYLWDRALALTLNACGVTAAALFIGMTASWLTAGVIAAGVPCRVIRKLTEKDKMRMPNE